LLIRGSREQGAGSRERRKTSVVGIKLAYFKKQCISRSAVNQRCRRVSPT